MRIAVVLLLAVLAFADDVDLVGRLGSSDRAIQEDAAAQVRKRPQHERDTIATELAKQLQDEDPRRRGFAARGLKALGPQAGAAVPQLVAATRDKVAWVRVHVLDALRKTETKAQGAVDAVLRAARDPNESVRAAACGALWELGGDAKPVLDALVRLLRDSAKRIRWSAAVALRRRGTRAAPSVTALAQALSDPAEDVRLAAVEALEAMNEHAQPALNALMDALRDESTEVVIHSAAALGQIGADAERVVPAIKRLLAHDEFEVRSGAAWAIGHFRGGAFIAVGELRRAASDENPAVRRTALGALREMFPDDDEISAAYETAWNEERAWRVMRHYDGDVDRAVRELTKALQSSDETTRTVAVHDLGYLGARARPAVPALTALLQDPEMDVRRAVLRTFERVPPKDLKPVVKSLRDPKREVREAARDLFEAVGDRGVTALIVALASDPDARASAAACLGRLGSKAKAA
ncbi:MAG: HEAT repeat domain-containing protein, partial [Planctomycetota bacterium]|nr:HEAT repeat domain-containing protein [Planctomycetota bacterium]